MGGSRLGTIGWDSIYWDHGKQYNKQKKLINQAHHFTAFLIEGYINNGYKLITRAKSELLDNYVDHNPQDIRLSILGAEVGKDIRTGKTT